jgi:hypothetical protein
MAFFIFMSTYVQRRQNFYIPNHEATEIPAANILKLALHASCVSNDQMSSTSDTFIWFWKQIQFPKPSVTFGF